MEVENLREVGTLLEFERANFVRFIFNGSWNSVTHRESIDRKGLNGAAMTHFFKKFLIIQWVLDIMTTSGHGK